MCLRRYKINGRGVRYLILGFAVLFLLVSHKEIFIFHKGLFFSLKNMKLII